MDLRYCTKKEAVSLLELIHNLTLCSEKETLLRLLKTLKALVPFESSSAILNKTGVETKVISSISFNIDYPEEYLKEYFERGYMNIDPIVKDNLGIYRLKYWGDTLRQYGIPKELLGLAEDFGFRHGGKGFGYCCGMRNLNDTESGLISFYGLRRDGKTETTLALIIPHIYEAMKRIISSEKRKPALSQRETEIIKWLMEGKDNWEISTILKISQRTVKFHINNIRQKLNAVNRTQAVAIAIREGLIELE